MDNINRSSDVTNKNESVQDVVKCDGQDSCAVAASQGHPVCAPRLAGRFRFRCRPGLVHWWRRSLRYAGVPAALLLSCSAAVPAAPAAVESCFPFLSLPTFTS
ncbi:hypothetical protein E2C01_064471 [Portunus trituberculatus]|uniref:Uncharacterized protein n=1 Tax=Portunus trituberculatus TaxID=210409 RepID=A0A5B7HD38_PORTR|nr:hypothetical protein [Portunus trituberculatus]